MKKRVNKLSSLLIALAMIVLLSIIPTYAEAPSLSDNAAGAEEIDQEYLTNNYEANITYNKILSSIETNDTELRSHFSGAYVNDDGYLVAQIKSRSNDI